MDSKRAAGLLCGVFFASGAAALSFETLWFRQAGLAFGNSIWASSLVLAAFMAGLAAGNALAIRAADRARRPLRTYALLEAAVGGSGVLLVLALPLLAGVLAPLFRPLLDRPYLLNPLRLSLAFLLLLLPSTAMGFTLPLLARVLGSWGEGFGKALGRLYGWNTLGAVTGTLLTEAVLLEALGVRGTALVAGSLNLLCAAAAASLSERMGETAAPDHCGGHRAVTNWQSLPWLMSASLTGAILLALEVVWFRFLSLYIFGYSLCFAVMLAVVLAGIALGGLAASWSLARRPSVYRYAGATALLGGVVVSVAYAAFPWVAEPLKAEAVKDVPRLLALAVPLMFPASLLSGFFFTLVGAGVREASPSDGSAAGRLTLWNTAGAAIGALLAGFFLLPQLGMERSIFLLALLYGLAALLLAPWERGRWRSAALAGVAFAVALSLFPWGAMVRRHVPNTVARWETSGASSVVAVREGLCETAIAVQAHAMGRPAYRRLITNAISMSGTGFPPRRYMELFVRIPQALHPRIRRALLISFGVGVTAGALADLKEAERIEVVDISPEILSMSPLFAPPGRDPLADPRVRVHVEDGRFFLQTTPERFDLITGEPPPPQMAGVVNLYTREYFRLVRDRLAEGGLATYWLPVHSLGPKSALAIIRAFCDAFPDATLWSGSGLNLMLMGSRGGPSPAPPESLRRPWADPADDAKMRAIGVERPEQLPALLLCDSAFLREVCAGALPVVDDFPKRIEQDPPPTGRVPEIYQKFLDAGEGRARFSSSPWAREVFPRDFSAASVPFFEVRQLVDMLIVLTPRDFFDPATFHNLVVGMDLRTPILLLLGSNMDRQRAAREAGWGASPDPEVQYHVAVELLSERRFEEALAPLEKAARFQAKKGWADALRVCALAELGRMGQARELAARLATTQPSIPPLFWRRMQVAYGPPASRAASPPPSSRGNP
jgi:spermidine synthase